MNRKKTKNSIGIQSFDKKLSQNRRKRPGSSPWWTPPSKMPIWMYPQEGSLCGLQANVWQGRRSPLWAPIPFIIHVSKVVGVTLSLLLPARSFKVLFFSGKVLRSRLWSAMVSWKSNKLVNVQKMSWCGQTFSFMNNHCVIILQEMQQYSITTTKCPSGWQNVCMLAHGHYGGDVVH